MPVKLNEFWIVLSQSYGADLRIEARSAIGFKESTEATAQTILSLQEACLERKL